MVLTQSEVVKRPHVNVKLLKKHIKRLRKFHGPVNNFFERQTMFSYSVVSTNDGLFEVVDELGTVVEVFDSRPPAHSYIRSLLKHQTETVTSRAVTGVRYGNKPVTEHVEEPEETEEGTVKPTVVEEPENSEIELLPVEPTPGKRNSDSVREAIAYAKANYFSEKAVIHWATVKLGMKKALASSYVKGNWHRA